MNNASVLLFFIDGLGIGSADARNPLFLTENIEPLGHFKNEISSVIFDGVMIPTDASLGIEGRPQSASGQTTILTGVNIPQTLGYHKQGFPNAAMRDILAEKSIFLQLKNLGIEPNVFVNAYTPQFFDQTPRWKSATTVAVEAAGMQFRRLPDLIGRHAVFHDFTNETLRECDFDAPLFSPDEAGEILANLISLHHFTLYEHFITDKIGHEQNFEKAKIHLPKLATFLRAVLERIDFGTTTVILTSDHGNLEDLSVRTHTLNKVPTIIWGRHRDKAAQMIRNLADITPSVIKLLSAPEFDDESFSPQMHRDVKQ